MSALAGPAQRKLYEQADLVRQLRELGLADGDVVLVRADFGKMGRIKKPADRVFVQSLLEAVGPSGTLLALTHSPVQSLFRRDRSYVYEAATAPCVTGRFAETVLAWPGAYRSSHPTCSMTAIGPLARQILARHDHTAICHAPIKSLMQAKGKMLVVGCVDSCPGFSTVHYAYEHLGLATQSLLSGWIGCYFKRRGHVSWFRQRDVPGCSLGFHKFYPLYRAHALLRSGLVGSAESYLIGAAEALAVESAAIAKDPTCSLCDNPECFSCRGTKLFNRADMVRFFITQVPRKLAKRLRRRHA